MTGDPLTLGIGIALLALGVDWRVRTLRHRRTEFRGRVGEALEDPDPIARRAAAVVILQHGLNEAAAQLLEATRRENNPAVLDAIAEGVARNQWEPSRRADVLELRLWAQRRLEERARSASNGRPAEPRTLARGQRRWPERRS
jgi:hypothetical protein